MEGGGASAKPKEPGPLAAKPGDALRVTIVEKPGAVQTVIRFMAPGVPVADPRRVKLRLLNELLAAAHQPPYAEPPRGTRLRVRRRLALCHDASTDSSSHPRM